MNEYGMEIVIRLFYGISIGGIPFLLGSVILLVGLLGRRKEKKVQKYRKFDFELVGKEDNNTTDPRSGAVLYTVTKYRARYWDNGERIAEFSVNDKMEQRRPYEVGDHFIGYVSPDGKEAVDENSPYVGGSSRIFLYIVVAVFYLISLALGVSMAVPEIGRYLIAYFPHAFLILLAVVGLGLVIVGIKICINARRFERRKKNHEYREIPATVKEVRVRYSSTKNGRIPVYYPVFSYEMGGKEQILESSTAESNSNYFTGQQVTLYQDTATREVMEDLKQNYSMALIMMVFGLVMTLMCLGVFYLITVS